MKIYTDASSRFISGISFVATNNRNKEIIRKSAIINISDNNTAELAAVVMAMRYARKHSQTPNEQITILTDSTYVIKAIRENHYRPQEEGLIKELQDHINNVNCNFMWIKGHTSGQNVLAHYNRIADKEANIARLAYEKMLIVTKQFNIDK